jgi:hypothetical protein
MIFRVFGLALVYGCLVACTMLSSWRSIPPPGGCEECHKVPISANWQVTYRAPNLTDERNRDYFQTEGYTLPKADRPDSQLEIRKVQEQACFDCHNAPNPAHVNRKSKYHH